MSQTSIAAFLLIIAVGYVAYRAKAAFMAKQGCRDGGCGCSGKGGVSAPDHSKTSLDSKKRAMKEPHKTETHNLK